MCATLSLYNFRSAKNDIHEQTHDLSYKMELKINKYFDFLMAYNALFLSSQVVTEEESAKFYKNLNINTKLDDILYFGWYSEDGKSGFTLNKEGKKTNLIDLKKLTLARKSGNDNAFFGLDPSDSSIFLGAEGQPDSIYSALKFKEGKYVFMVLDWNKIQNDFLKIMGDKPYSLTFYLNGSAIQQDKNIIGNNKNTIQSIAFGDRKFYAVFHAQKSWSFFSVENILSLVAFLAGSAFLIALTSFFTSMRETANTSELARSNAEREMINLNNFYQKILENLPAVLFIKDAKNDFRYHMFNKEAEKFFGFSRDDMIGKQDNDFFNEEESNFFRSMDIATMNGRKVIDIPCELVTTASGESFVHTRKVPIYDVDGEPSYLVGLSEDITKRKKYEMELTEYRQNLERMVEERTQKLKDAMIRAEEGSRLKSEFLATMSHEIRSPMSGVLGMAELLLDTPLTREQRGLTRTILTSGEVLMNIIEDILDFSKIEANRIELDPVAVNMLDLVDDVCMLFSSRARDKALEIAVHYTPGSEQFVYADLTRVRQVLGNLVNNAIKFTHSGYIIITVWEDRENPPDNPEDVSLVFSVKDTGIGIVEEDHERIFEKFSQANSSTTRDYGGTGLGLSISRKLVELMGGKMTLKSQLGIGSEFIFRIPMKRNREEAYTYPRPPVLSNRRVLIVDDIPVIRTVVSEILTMAGMVCDVAANGKDALRKMAVSEQKGQKYDIVLIDYLMPDMNGDRLAETIHQNPHYSDICLIMLTAAGNPPTSETMNKYGFSAYITKPVRTAPLIDSIAMVWEKYSNGDINNFIRLDSPKHITDDLIEDLKLPECRILLVEDSRLNQAFVEEVIAQLECEVITVSNGREALEAIESETFDLVLMDCQMPIMDGFEASRRICEMKTQGKVNPEMPILALTANAMKDDRKRCLEAGMNDYITKPVRKKELKDKIYYWIKNESVRGDDEKESADTLEGVRSAEIIDIQLFEEARTILKDKFDTILVCYLEDMESYIREIEQAAANRNFDALVRPAHTIKSTSKRMGAMCLAGIASDIELAAREAANQNNAEIFESPVVIEGIKRIINVFEETRVRLESLRSG